MRTLWSAITLASVIVAQTPATAQQSPALPVALSGADAQRLLVGNTLTGINEFRKRYWIQFNRDGSVKARAENVDQTGMTPQIVYDFGIWEIRGDRVCIKMDHWVAGSWHCSVITRDGTQYQRNGMPVTITPG